MQKVLKNIFLIDDKLESNLKFWVLLGPFLLFLNIALATFELALFTIIGLFLCYRFKFKGLVLSLMSLVIYCFYVQINLEDKHLWNLGLQISIALGLIISTYSFDEIKNYLCLHENVKSQDFLKLQKELKEKQDRFDTTEKNLEENLIILKKELDKKSQNLQQVSQENENLKKDLQDTIHRKDYLLNELDHKVKEIEQLYVKQDELYEKISFLKDEEFLQEKNKKYQQEIEKLKNINELQNQEKDKILKDLDEKKQKIKELIPKLSKVKNIEEFENKIKEKEKEIINLKQKIKNLPSLNTDNITDKDFVKEYKRLHSLYVQLKSQFEEKQLVLHKTRQELFEVKEKLVASQKEKNDDFEDLNEYEKIILSELDKTIEDLQKYKKENNALVDLISFLLNKK